MVGYSKGEVGGEKEKVGLDSQPPVGDAAGQGSKTQGGKRSVCDLGKSRSTYLNFETSWRDPKDGFWSLEM